MSRAAAVHMLSSYYYNFVYIHCLPLSACSLAATTTAAFTQTIQATTTSEAATQTMYGKWSVAP